MKYAALLTLKFRAGALIDHNGSTFRLSRAVQIKCRPSELHLVAERLVREAA